MVPAGVVGGETGLGTLYASGRFFECQDLILSFFVK
jgi:hypothetical protein